MLRVASKDEHVQDSEAFDALHYIDDLARYALSYAEKMPKPTLAEALKVGRDFEALSHIDSSRLVSSSPTVEAENA